MTAMRVQPDEGPPVYLLPGGSRVTDEEAIDGILEIAILKLRASNQEAPARPKSYAITQLQDALLWLTAFDRGEIR
jgi:hypothetical protein